MTWDVTVHSLIQGVGVAWVVLCIHYTRGGCGMGGTVHSLIHFRATTAGYVCDVKQTLYKLKLVI